jgi:hypothetical protein
MKSLPDWLWCFGPLTQLAVAEQYQTNFIKGTGINVWDPDRRENLDPAQFLNLVQNSDALVNFRLSLPFSITDFSGKKYYWETLGLVQSQIKLLGYAADFISVDGTENAIYQVSLPNLAFDFPFLTLTTIHTLQANVYNQNEDLVCLLFFTPHLCNALSNFYGLSRVKKMVSLSRPFTPRLSSWAKAKFALLQESHFNGIIRLYVDDDGLLHPDFSESRAFIEASHSWGFASFKLPRVGCLYWSPSSLCARVVRLVRV